MGIVGKEMPVVIDLDVILVLFGINFVCFSRFHIRQQQLQVVLVAVHTVKGQKPRIAGPFDPGNIDIGLGAGIDQRGFFRREIINEDGDQGIVFPGFGIFIFVLLRIELAIIGKLVFFDFGFIKTIKGQGISVGRPAESL